MLKGWFGLGSGRPQAARDGAGSTSVQTNEVIQQISEQRMSRMPNHKSESGGPASSSENGLSGPSSLPANDRDTAQRSKQSGLPHGGWRVEVVSSTPANTRAPIQDEEPRQPRKTIKPTHEPNHERSVTFTSAQNDPFAPQSIAETHGGAVRGTKVQSRSSQNGGHVVNTRKLSITRDQSMQSQKSASSSRATVGEEQLDEHTPQGGIPQTHFPLVTEIDYPTTSSPTAEPTETGHFMAPSESTGWEAELRSEIDRLQHEEKERLLARMKAGKEKYRLLYEQQLEDLRSENQRLQQETSDSASRISLLQNQLDSCHGSHPETVEADETALIDIATMITIVISHFELWKGPHVVTKRGNIMLSIKEVEHPLSILSTASSQIAELLQRYAAPSGDYNSSHHNSQMTVSQSDEKDNVIASLIAEVADLKANIQAVHGENENLQHELQSKSSLIEEMNNTIASLTTQDTQAEQPAGTRNRVEQLQIELSSASSTIADLQEHCKAQSQELDSVHDQVNLLLPSGVPGEISNDPVVEQLRWAVEEKNRQMEYLGRDLAASTSQNIALQQSHEAVSQDLSNVRQKLEVKTSQLESTNRPTALHSPISPRGGGERVTTLDTQLEQRRQRQLRPEASVLKYKERSGDNEDLRHYLVEERHLQLDALERFVSTADAYGDTTIIQMLQQLNAEVQQNTTFIAECILKGSQRRGKASTREQIPARQRISEWIGRTLAGCLKGNDVDLYLPIAFQAYLAYHLCSVVSLWTIDKGNNDFIDTVYQRLREKEAQMISGNWRSLTRTYLWPTCSSDPRHLISSTITGFSDIIVAAGCAASVSAAQSMLSPFEDKMTSMILIAGQFNEMIGQVASGDFEVFAVRPDEVFEESMMEEDKDEYDEREGAPKVPPAGQKVLCSTYLGLTKRTSLESGEKNVLTVVKAKVLFESFLDG